MGGAECRRTQGSYTTFYSYCQVLGCVSFEWSCKKVKALLAPAAAKQSIQQSSEASCVACPSVEIADPCHLMSHRLPGNFKSADGSWPDGHDKVGSGCRAGVLDPVFVVGMHESH